MSYTTEQSFLMFGCCSIQITPIKQRLNAFFGRRSRRVAFSLFDDHHSGFCLVTSSVTFLSCARGPGKTVTYRHPYLTPHWNLPSRNTKPVVGDIFSLSLCRDQTQNDNGHTIKRQTVMNPPAVTLCPMVHHAVFLGQKEVQAKLSHSTVHLTSLTFFWR